MPAYAVLFGDKSRSEVLFVTQYLWQALYAVLSLSMVAPSIEVRLRVLADRALGGEEVLNVRQGRWRVVDPSKPVDAFLANQPDAAREGAR